MKEDVMIKTGLATLAVVGTLAASIATAAAAERLPGVPYVGRSGIGANVTTDGSNCLSFDCRVHYNRLSTY
jgi:hypothetical protein